MPVPVRRGRALNEDERDFTDVGESIKEALEVRVNVKEADAVCI